MTEYEFHQKIKYGDLIYIEFTYEKKRTRNIISGGQFNIKGNCDIEIKKINLSNNSIFLKDFENNLFIIFPKMKDEFTDNKNLLNAGISMLKEKIKTSKTLSSDQDFKNSISQTIKAFHEAKQDVYSENEKFMDDIGKPINYEDDFILIHLKTHCFVQRVENFKSTALSLSPSYSDECVFFFSQYSSLIFNLKYVFSNQNIFICKRQKNMWANNQFLIVRPKNIEKNIYQNYIFDTENNKEKNLGSSNFTLDFNEGQGQAFQIKICSNYIDPSSSNLTFATPVWLVIQSIDKYLNVTSFPKIECINLDNTPINNNNVDNMNINNENINKNNILPLMEAELRKRNTSPNQNYSNDILTKFGNLNHISIKSEAGINNIIKKTSSVGSINEQNLQKHPSEYKISYDSTDKEKSINNINGLFFIEQYDETLDIESLTDEYLKEKLQLQMELKMPSFVEYHKVIRFRHIITKKYLGFKEKKSDKKSNSKNITNNKINNENNNNESYKGKTNGNLIFMDIPDENCNWMFLESYKNLESDRYLKSKINGIASPNKKEENQEEEEKEEDDQKNESDENSENDNNKKDDKKEIISHKIKNNEILRIFHIKTQKFLCFDEVTNKIGSINKTKTLLKEDLYNPVVDKKVYVQNLTLSKVPYDSDLVRLLPFEPNQTLEIPIVLYFKNKLFEEIDFITNKNYRKLLGIDDVNSLKESIEMNAEENNRNSNINNNFENNINNNLLRTNYNNMTNNTIVLQTKTNKTNQEGNNDKFNYKSKKYVIAELKAVKDRILLLIESFKNITDYCLNNFSRKYDINISPGKPLNYRQQFLLEQGVLKKAFKYLEFTIILSEIYNEYRDYAKKKFEETERASTLRNTMHLMSKKHTHKSMKSFNENERLELSNNPEFIIIELFKNLNESIRLSFEFIYSMCKKNNNNKKFAFRQKKIFLHYFLEYEEASKCFMDLLKENENIMNLINNIEKRKDKNKIENDFEDEEEESNIIDKILFHLNKSKNYEPKNLSLLSKFLILGDSGITSNQQYIFEELFYNGKDRFLIKIKPLFNDIAFKVVYKDENKKYIEKNLIEFCNNRVLSQQGIINYLAEQLNLYANLCYGRNYVCIEKIRKMFPLDHLIYHISKVELNQDIIAGLINILNYIYIDIEPHIMKVYPTIIKRVTPDLRIERINKDKIKTYIPLNKLNLILCLSLFLLNNIKYGSVLVNTANINLIFNIIKFHLYENLVYSPMNIEEVININLNQKLHNLKDEVKYNVIYGEELLINKKSDKQNNKSENKKKQIHDDIFDLVNNEEEQKLINEQTIDDIKNSDKKEILGNLNSFYNKYGYKYIEFDFESPLGEEYILFVLDRINDFFMTSLILNNIDNNTEDKNIISQNFKSVTKNDILTQSNINYLMETLIDIKTILTKGNQDLDNSYILIMKQIEKVINYIMNIKQEDMSIYILENLLKVNYQLISDTIEDKEQIGDNFQFLYPVLKEKLYSLSKINDILMDNEFYYYQLFNKINFYDNIPKFHSNFDNPKDSQVINALLKKDKIPEENKRLLNNSLFGDETSLIKSDLGKYKDFQNLTNNDYTNNFNLPNDEYHDSEYYYNLKMPSLEINFDNFYINSVIFKNMIELIIRILEMNVNGKLTKILLRIFKRLISQREDLFNSMQNILLLYKENDLEKYYLCNISIKELSLLAEKTEKWMTDDHIPLNIKYIEQIENIDIKDIDEDKKDFFLVYSTIYKYLSMIIDLESNTYYEESEVKLAQAMLYSFQMESILSSLMKEIIQEYPQDENTINNVITVNHNEIGRGSMRYTINSKHSFISFLKKQKLKKNKINEYIKQEKEYVYKNALEKLLKLIFKLLLVLIYDTSPNLNKEIIELVDFSKEYKYLFNFGLLQLIVELSSDSKYVLYNTKFLVDLVNEQLKLDNIKQFKDHFYDYNKFFKTDDFVENNPKIDNKKDKKKIYIKSLKGYSYLLKLMKNITGHISDDKYWGRLLNKYYEILTVFDFFSNINPFNINNNNFRASIYPNESYFGNLMKRSSFMAKSLRNIKTIESKIDYESIDINCKISYYRIVFTYYLIKIAVKLVKKSQQIKNYIFGLINLRKFIKFIFDWEFPFSTDQIESIIREKQYRKTKIFLKLMYYFKLKYIGCKLILSLYRFGNEKRKYIAKNLETYYTKLKDELDYAFLFKAKLEEEENLKGKYINYNIVYEKYKRHMYKYFFKGIFPLIYSNLPKFNEKLFKDYQDYQRVKNEYKLINKSWAKMHSQLYEEKNKKPFKKLFAYMANKRKEYQYLFTLNEYPKNNIILLKETKTIKYIQDLKKTLNGPEDSKLSSLIKKHNYKNEILYEMTIHFINDIVNEFENEEVIVKCIKREKKITAMHIKTKINFHLFLKKYIEDENLGLNKYQITHEAEIHLVNVFLKFIRENADNTKYFPVIKELIELMAYLVLVTPEILKREKKVKKRYPNFFDLKVNEFKQYFFEETQKSFLNNGTIEIFLKIASKRGKYFKQNVFNMIVYFFITILEGGNNDIQKKFMQLFQLLPDNDNFFRSINQTFDKDIFFTLNEAPFSEEICIDNQNLKVVTDKLRFLQLLTENHNLFLQNYLREQTNNRISYNFVNILIEYLSMLLEKLGNLNDKYKSLTRYYTELYYKRLLSLLDTICEFLQGPCKKNQEYLIETKIIELFNKIMEETCIVSDDKDEDNSNDEDNNEENNTVYSLSTNKNIQTDTFLSETLTFNMNSLMNDDYFYADNILQKKIFASLSDYEKSTLLFKISLVLLSMIEGRKVKDEVIKKILRDINYKLVFEKCGEIYKKLKDNMYFFLFTEKNTKDIEDLDDKVVSEAGFNLYFLMETLVSLETEETELKINSLLILDNDYYKYDEVQKEKIRDIFNNAETIQNAIEFFKKNSLSIEILKDDEVFKVYCPKLQFFNAFDEKMKKKFDEKADRTSIQTKLTSIINEKEQIYITLKQIDYLEQQYKKLGPLKYLLIYPDYVQLGGLILIVIMNILIFLGYNAEKDEDQRNVVQNIVLFGLSGRSSTAILHILGIIILIFNIIIFIEFVAKDAVIIYKNLYGNFLKSSYEYKIGYVNDFEIHRVYNFLKASGYSLFFNKLFIYIKLIFNLRVLYRFCYIVFAILGLFVHHFFFAFHLIEFIKSQPILKIVFLAFYVPLAQFAYTFIFFLILIYFYSLLIFYRYYDLMPEFTCNSPLICMMYIYSNTFTSGGNLGNFIDTKEESINYSGDMERYALDISYTIIMVWLVWQIITGLIVNSFDSLRGDRELLEEDMETKCFICDLKRQKIEKYYLGKEGFEKHLQDHSVKNYFFYIFYLEEKDPNEYSGLESYVKSLIDKESTGWFPIGRSLKIEEWKSKHKA